MALVEDGRGGWYSVCHGCVVLWVVCILYSVYVL